MSEIQDHHLVEALLLTSKEPLTIADMQDRLPIGIDISDCLLQLASDYADRSIMVAEVPGGWTVRTRPEYSDLCRELLPKPPRLTKPTLETLATIAYFQPVTRSEIERIRGVSLAKGSLDVLIWNGLVRPGPRRTTPGNPLTFVTTDQFLRQYAFKEIEDMPHIAEWREQGLLDAQRAMDVKDLPEAGDL